MQRDETKEIYPPISQMGADSKDRQTHAIIGAAMEVHRQLGPGVLEAVHQQALAIEFSARTIPFLSEAELPVYYKGQRLACYYRADFVSYDEVIVELKALKVITGVEEAQVLNYLKATGLGRALLLNFGCPSLEFKRLVFSHLRTSAESADATKS
jgi:GxxExxY protein